MQMVNLMRDGQPVRMSKRTGNAITLTDLLEEVPIDSARFLFNMHDAGSGIDFDLDQAVKTDNDNPVYYVQYAHARICSILKKMESEGVAFAGAENIDATLLTEPSEMDLIRMLAAFPQEIVMAAEKYDPSRINRFVSTWPAPSTASTAAAASRAQTPPSSRPVWPSASASRTSSSTCSPCSRSTSLRRCKPLLRTL